MCHGLAYGPVAQNSFKSTQLFVHLFNCNNVYRLGYYFKYDPGIIEGTIAIIIMGIIKSMDCVYHEGCCCFDGDFAHISTVLLRLSEMVFFGVS